MQAVRLKGSVGFGGKNNLGDVVYVQILVTDWLLLHGKPAIALDGIVGPQTIGAIRQFQQANIPVVDGLVEPNRSTIKMLELRHIETIQNHLFPSAAVVAAIAKRPATDYFEPTIEIDKFFDSYLRVLRG